MSIKLKIYYNTILGALGGLFAWFILGNLGSFDHFLLRDFVSGIFIGFFIGGLIGSVDGIFDKSLYKIKKGIIYGGCYGIAGGVLGLFIGELTLWIFKGGILGRAFGWMFLGLLIGISEGIAIKAPKKINYGAIGGCIGGFMGGAIFEIFRTTFGSYIISQAIGLVILGACIGSLIALVEDILREAWVTVLTGRQEGREFTLAKKLVSIGRDERCDIAIFGDDKIEKDHGEFRYSNGTFALNKLGRMDTILSINGNDVNSPIPLHDNDMIQIGNSRLIYRQKARAKRSVNSRER